MENQMDAPVKQAPVSEKPKMTNLEYLENGLKYMGFPESLNKPLAAKIAEGVPEFHIKMNTSFDKPNGVKDQVEYSLNFKKGKEGDNYFFNNYDAKLQAPQPDGTTSETKQKIWVDKNHGITAKEAYNILDGRSVQREVPVMEKIGDAKPIPKWEAGENGKQVPVLQTVWQKLDFKDQNEHGNFKVQSYNEKYGFDLSKSLENLPARLDRGNVVEMADPTKKRYVEESLMRGNLTAVTFEKDGNKEKLYLAANPQFKGIDVYDESLKKQFIKNEVKAAQDIKVEVKDGSSTVAVPKVNKAEGDDLKVLTKPELKEIVKAMDKEGIKYVVLPTDENLRTKDNVVGFKGKAAADEHAMSNVSKDVDFSMKGIKEMKKEVGISEGFKMKP